MKRSPNLARSVCIVAVALAVPFSLAACTSGEPAASKGSGANASDLSPTGNFHQQVAFDVPPFHGLEPSLGIAYDSSGVDGVPGTGWTLMGTSTVRRASPGRGAPQYQASDVFLRDGAELTPCSPGMKSPSCQYPPSAKAAAYTTETESYQRIARFEMPDGRTLWKVWTTTGTVFTYEHRQAAPGSQVSAWDLAAVEDTYGNRVDYDWVSDTTTPGAGASYLESVRYGEVVVRLRYQSRPDSYSYADGKRVVDVRKRLTSVQVQVGHQTARAYQLDYIGSKSSGRSVLAKVQEFGNDSVVCDDSTNVSCTFGRVVSGSALPARTFRTPSLAVGHGDWQPVTTPLTGAGSTIGPSWPGQPYGSGDYQTLTGWLQPSSTSRRPRFRVADINGDGRDDVLALRYFKDSSGLVHQALSTAIATRTGYRLVDFEPDPTNIDELVGIHEDYFTADADGDGSADIMQITNDDPSTADNEKHLQVWRSNGDGTYVRTADDAVTWPYIPTVASCFSFNVGIGIGFGPLSVGASWNVYSHCDVNLDQQYFVGDVDGDGRADVLGASHDAANTVTLHTALSSGDAFVIKPDVPTSWAWSDTNTGRDRFFPADINGDGRVDVVHVAYHAAGRLGDPVASAHAALDIALSNGDGTFSFTGEHVGSAWDDEDVWYPGDVNGDNKTDIVHVFRAPATSTGSYTVGLSDGSGTASRWLSGTTTFPWYRPAPGGNTNKWPAQWLVGDVDGDRRSDIVSVSEVAVAGNLTQNMAVVLSGPGNSFTNDPAYLRGVEPNPWPWTTPQAVPAHLGDLNADGKADLVMTPWVGPGFHYPLEIFGHLSPNRALDTAGWRPADVNGDGREDLVYVYYRNPGYTVYTLLRRPDGTYQRAENGVDLLNMPGAIADLTTPDTSRWMVADVGGGPGGSADGRADLVYVDHVADKRLTVYTLVSEGDGRYRHHATPFLLDQNSQFPARWEPRAWMPADIDGDGRSDLLSVYHDDGQARIHALVRTGTDGWVWKRYGFFQGLSPGDSRNWQPADVNDDGRTDLVMASAAGAGAGTTVRTLVATRTGTWTPKTTSPTDANGVAPQFKDTRRWLVMEANGDGMTDLGYLEAVAGGTRMHTLTSRGDGGYDYQASPTLPAPAGIDVSDVVAFRRLDVDGDGRTDLVHVSATTVPGASTATTAVVVLANAAPGWRVEHTNGISDSFPDASSWRPMDQDGDGRSDLVYVAPAVHTLRLPVASDAVDRVRSPLGGTSDVHYSPSSTWQANQPGSGCHLPLGHVRNAVDSVTTSDGRPGAPTTVHRYYSCAAWSDAHRSFLGWQEVYEFRPATMNQSAATRLVRYDMSDACLARPTYQQTYDAKGDVFDKTITTYLPKGSSPPYRCQLGSTNHVLLNQWVAAPNDYVHYTYDDFGNVTTLVEEGDPDTARDDRNTSWSYHPNTGAFVVGLPSGQQVREGKDSSGTLLRTTISCYDGDTSLTCTQAPTKGSLTATTELNLNGLADMAVTRFAYDAAGNLTGRRSPNGNMSSLFYDTTRTYPTLSCNAVQQCVNIAWDHTLGRVKRLEDMNQRVTNVAYDAFGRVKVVDLPGGGQLRRDYLNWGDPNKQRIHEILRDGSPDGLWHDVTLDGLGRVYKESQESDTSGTSFVRDTMFAGSDGLVYQRSDWHQDTAAPVFATFAYDAIGRQTRLTHADGASLRWEYGANGDATWIRTTDELGQQRRVFADAHGRAVRTEEWVDGQRVQVNLTYNGLDQLRTMTDPGGNVTTWTWDNRGRQIGMTDPDRGTHAWTYDLDGNVLTHTDGRKLTTRFTYDPMDRLKTKTDPDGRILTWRYDELGHPDGNGRLTSVTDSHETSCPGTRVGSFDYDARGESATLWQCAAGITTQVTRTSDVLRRPDTLTYPDGQVVSYHYDAAGRLKDMPGLVDKLAYDAAGRLTDVDYANGTHAAYGIDPQRGWLDSVLVTSPMTTVFHVAYERLPNAAVKRSTSATNAMNVTYGYDSLNRLRTVSGDINQTLDYDVTGNLTHSSSAGYFVYPTPSSPGCGLVTKQMCPHAVTSVSSPSGASKSFRYDNNGSVTLATRTDSGGATASRSIEWNADAKPVSIEDYGGTATTLRYGPFGNRTYRERAGQATVSLGKLVDVAFPVAGGPVTTRKEYYAGPLHVASSTGGAVAWNVTDYQQTPRVLVDAQAGVIGRADYEPYGSRLGTGAPSMTFSFLGERADDDNGFVDLNARYYDAGLGRFLSPDPVVLPSEGSQQLNPYTYAAGNPVSNSDPSGLCVAAQETCIEVSRAVVPPAEVMRFEPVTISGNWVAPEDRVHAGCSSCSLLATLSPPPQDTMTLGQALEQGLIREGKVSGVTSTGMPIQQEPIYDDFPILMGTAFAKLANVQAQGLGGYSAAADLAVAAASRASTTALARSADTAKGGSSSGGSAFRDFAHGTAVESAESIAKNGLNEGAAAALSRGGKFGQPGAFFTFEVSAANREGLQLAYEMGLRQGQSCVLVCRMPATLFDDLAAANLVRTGTIPGVAIGETVFLPGAFPKLNEAVRSGLAWWQIIRP